MYSASVIPPLQASPPILDIEKSTARITLNRPLSHNRLEIEDIERLIELCSDLNAKPSIESVVLQATGPTFCSGFDIRLLRQNPKRDVRRFEHLIDCIEGLNAITIARLHAPVVGGSTDLVLACDFKVAAQGIKARMPAVSLGIHYYPNGMRRWVARLGASASRRLFLLGEEITDVQMLRLGFIDELVPSDSLDSQVNLLLRRLESGAPGVRTQMKKSINELSRGDFNEAALYGRLDTSLEGLELAEALESYAEKRKPVYR